MIIYKDKISGDEMLSDIYKMKLIDDLYWEVDGKIVSESTTVNDAMFGGNASAEGGGDEDGENAALSGCSIVLANRLQKTQFGKKDFGQYIKKYCKALLEQLKKDEPERAQVFEAGMPVVMKKFLKNFDNWEFFTGESQSHDGMIALLDFREDGETPYMVFFKDGLIEEKV